MQGERDVSLKEVWRERRGDEAQSWVSAPEVRLKKRHGRTRGRWFNTSAQDLLGRRNWRESPARELEPTASYKLG
jgi:hypothetical protein